MPSFEITAPNGRKYSVTGADAQGALAALKQHIGDSSPTPSFSMDRGLTDQLTVDMTPSGKTSRNYSSGHLSQPNNAGAERMQRYDVDIRGERFEVEAPDDDSARRAVAKLAQSISHPDFEEGQALLQQQDENRMNGASGAAGAGLTGFIDGIPVLGPLMLGGAQRAAAGISSLIDGESYPENLRQAQGITRQAQEAHPYITTGANVAGGVAGTVPLIAAAPAAFGAGTAGIGTRSLAAGLSGSALGGTDAAVRSGGDIERTALGAGIGGGMGLIGPMAGKVIGTGVQNVYNAITNRAAAASAGASTKTVRAIGRIAERDGLDASGIAARLDELGPEATLMDVGPGMQARAGGLAAFPGRAQSIMRDAIEARQAGANSRLLQAVDDTLGPNVVPSQVDAGIAGNQNTLGPLYGEVFKGARAVNTTPIADALESQGVNLRGDAQQAVQRVRRILNIAGTDVLDPDPGTLFQTRQAIDGMLATEANPQAIRALTGARQQIDDTLARSVPGLKDVDAAYAELARQREALGRGQSVLESGRTAPRPAEFAVKLEQGALPQGTQIGPSAVPLRLSQGARAEVDRILGNNANDVAALQRIVKGDGDWNRVRLAILFGKEKADQLFRVLDAERTFADTRQIVSRNSETMRRGAAMAEISGDDANFGFVRQAAAAGGALGAIRGAAISGAEKLASALRARGLDAANSEMARVMTSRDRALIEALRQRQSLPKSDPRVERLTKTILLGSGTAAQH